MVRSWIIATAFLIPLGVNISFAHKPPPLIVDWDVPGLDVIYGATFDLTKAPQRVDAEEVYQFVEKGQRVPKLLGYCVVTDSGRCFREPILNNEIRLQYTYYLEKNRNCSNKNYLYQELILSGQEVLLFYRGQNGEEMVQPLARFSRLKDGFGNQDNKRMTTVVMPRNTFIALDQSEREPSASLDIIHYPRPFLDSRLDRAPSVITRVNPNIPFLLRWGCQRLVSTGVDNVVGQWMLLSLSSVTPLALAGWLVRWVRRKRAPLAPTRFPIGECEE